MTERGMTRSQRRKALEDELRNGDPQRLDIAALAKRLKAKVETIRKDLGVIQTRWREERPQWHDHVLHMLRKTAIDAAEAGNYTAAVRAWETIAKCTGLLEGGTRIDNRTTSNRLEITMKDLHEIAKRNGHNWPEPQTGSVRLLDGRT